MNIVSLFSSSFTLTSGNIQHVSPASSVDKVTVCGPRASKYKSQVGNVYILGVYFINFFISGELIITWVKKLIALVQSAKELQTSNLLLLMQHVTHLNDQKLD